MVARMEWIYEEKRIYLLDENGNLVCEANLSYQDENTMIIQRIYVEPEYRNKGFADLTMQTVMAYVEKNTLKVVPVCPYAIAWLDKRVK